MDMHTDAPGMQKRLSGEYFNAAYPTETLIGDGYSGMVDFRTGHGAHDRRPEFITDDDIFLSGFVDKERNVTYESHDFWIQFERRRDGTIGGRYRANVIVHNGRGVLAVGVEYHLAVALKALVDAGQMIAAYHMCWGIFDAARDLVKIGAETQQRKIYEAFVEGRLKKRKNRGAESYRVTIEPKGN